MTICKKLNKFHFILFLKLVTMNKFHLFNAPNQKVSFGSCIHGVI